MIVIPLKYVELRYEPRKQLVSVFPDGRQWGSYPHNTHHYHVIAHRCGYGDDIWSYCFEHEFCHHFVAQWLGDEPSYVLSCLAAGIMPDRHLGVSEEVITQVFQRWLRANERPIVSDVDWTMMKQEATKILRN